MIKLSPEALRCLEPPTSLKLQHGIRRFSSSGDELMSRGLNDVEDAKGRRYQRAGLTTVRR